MLREIKRHNIHLQAKYRCNQCFHFWIHSEEKETFVLEQLWSVAVLKKKKKKPLIKPQLQGQPKVTLNLNISKTQNETQHTPQFTNDIHNQKGKQNVF